MTTATARQWKVARDGHRDSQPYVTMHSADEGEKVLKLCLWYRKGRGIQLFWLEVELRKHPKTGFTSESWVMFQAPSGTLTIEPAPRYNRKRLAALATELEPWANQVIERYLKEGILGVVAELQLKAGVQ